MQKVIRLTAIIATVLSALSLVLLLISIPLQRVLAETFFGMGGSVLNALPQVPLIPLVIGFLRAGCVALLIICCGNKKGGYWLELLVFFFLVLCLPLLNMVSASLNNLLYNSIGLNALTASGVVTSIASYCTIPATIGQAIAYLACGMSIAFKHMAKKSDNMQ